MELTHNRVFKCAHTSGVETSRWPVIAFVERKSSRVSSPSQPNFMWHVLKTVALCVSNHYAYMTLNTSLGEVPLETSRVMSAWVDQCARWKSYEENGHRFRS